MNLLLPKVIHIRQISCNNVSMGEAFPVLGGVQRFILRHMFPGKPLSAFAATVDGRKLLKSLEYELFTLGCKLVYLFILGLLYVYYPNITAHVISVNPVGVTWPLCLFLVGLLALIIRHSHYYYYHDVTSNCRGVCNGWFSVVFQFSSIFYFTAILFWAFKVPPASPRNEHLAQSLLCGYIGGSLVTAVVHTCSLRYHRQKERMCSCSSLCLGDTTRLDYAYVFLQALELFMSWACYMCHRQVWLAVVFANTDNFKLLLDLIV